MTQCGVELLVGKQFEVLGEKAVEKCQKCNRYEAHQLFNSAHNTYSASFYEFVNYLPSIAEINSVLGTDK